MRWHPCGMPIPCQGDFQQPTYAGSPNLPKAQSRTSRSTVTKDLTTSATTMWKYPCRVLLRTSSMSTVVEHKASSRHAFACTEHRVRHLRQTNRCTNAIHDWEDAKGTLTKRSAIAFSFRDHSNSGVFSQAAGRASAPTPTSQRVHKFAMECHGSRSW